jgi:hypothetical protein
MKLLVTALLAPMLLACASDPNDDRPDTVVDDGKADGVELDVSSPNARPGARFLKKRSVAQLHALGALTPVLAAIVQRMAGYGQTDLSVVGLLFVEDPNRYATFLPEEKAAFPDLWKLLEIDDAIDLNAASDFPSLPSLVEVRRPEPGTLDTAARVSITALPPALQTVARRVIKPATVPPETISYAETVTALVAFQQYTSAEYFHFGPLLRATERALVTPATFPHLDVVAPIEMTAQASVGPVAVAFERKSSKRCQAQFATTTVTGDISYRLTIPTGTSVTWTPLDAAGVLSTEVLTAANATNRTFESPPYYGTGPAPRGRAIVEAWQGGARIAQQLVVVPMSEKLFGDGLAVRDAGNSGFACLPFDDAYDADDSDSLSNVMRLPPGRYPVPAGSYGIATLNVYGLGVMRLDVSQKPFWTVQKPSPTSSITNTCWTLTELGPRNMVTGAAGAGPGFRLNFQTSGVFFAEVSYGVCAGGANSGGGSLVTTLTEAGRL